MVTRKVLFGINRNVLKVSS